MRAAGRPVVASDLHDVTMIDFLQDDPPVRDCFAAIVTNPPFNALDRFMARGLHLMDAGRTKALVLLIRNDALMTSRRVDMLNRAAFVLGCNWRARWIADSTGQPRWAFSWLIWRADHHGPPITLRLRVRAA